MEQVIFTIFLLVICAAFILPNVIRGYKDHRNDMEVMDQAGWPPNRQKPAGKKKKGS